MDLTNHDMSELFAQLGLPNQPDEIDRFMAEHRPLAEGIRLPDASFWTPVQAQFLREEWREDADWVELIDQLNLALR